MHGEEELQNLENTDSDQNDYYNIENSKLSAVVFLDLAKTLIQLTVPD